MLYVFVKAPLSRDLGGSLSKNVFSKNFLIKEKIFFGIGASTASFIFFFIIGYLSKYLSRYAKNKKTWQYINLFIICFMSLLTFYIAKETLNFFR